MAKDNAEDPELKARSVALRLLARREHSRQELRFKLLQRQLPEPVIESVLDDYEARDWLSDERFADVYARQRKDLAYGPLRIRAELQQRGVSVWPACVADLSDSDWSELAIRARERRFGLACVDDDVKEKSRQARFLAQRGFSAAHSERALQARELPGDTG